MKRSHVKFKASGGQTHGVLPESLRKAFKAKYPDLPAPRSIVFPKGGGSTPIGVVFNEKVNGNFDLGMGVKHQHSATGAAMEHVWFTPDNLDLAYADSMGGTTRKVTTALASDTTERRRCRASSGRQFADDPVWHRRRVGRICR